MQISGMGLTRQAQDESMQFKNLTCVKADRDAEDDGTGRWSACDLGDC